MKPYREGTTRPPISGGSGASVCIAYRAARGDRKSWKALQRWLAKGGLPPEEEMFVLDNLITSGLLLAESGLRPQLDTWSLRALQLGPNSKRVIAKRGAVLVDLGLHREGKALLEQAASVDQISPRDSFVMRMFLARAELVLGNAATAHVLIKQANAILPQISGGKRRSVKVLQEWATQQAAELERYRVDTAEAPILSIASLRMTYQLGRIDASKDDDAQRDVWETLVRELALGGMLPEEEMFLLDQLVTEGDFRSSSASLRA
jgi:uncharacterized protein (DUF1778 family)